MSQTQTVWHMMEVRRRGAVCRHWLNVLLAACLLSAIAAGEVMFLNYASAPEAAAELLAAAEGVNTDAR
jgi:hypothetical protein